MIPVSSVSALSLEHSVHAEASLGTYRRCPFRRLLCWSQNDQGSADDNEGSHANQFSACDQT